MNEAPYQIPTAAATPAPEPAPEPAAPAAPPEPEAKTEELEPPPMTASEGVHPFSISPEEGAPAVPQEVILKKLAGIAALKAGAVLMYTVYADAIRAPFRDSLYAHFEEHLAEERAGIYDFNMKIVALGGQLIPKATKPPVANGIQEILTAVIQYEKELIGAIRELHGVCGDYLGLKLMLEDNLLKDQKHLDDARRMLVEIP